ncbi:hypothetical protein B0T12DRAFT_413463 [Alternaria alternata]|nr:hypothetical protein B0T12DRAFT_413463 [Alternaria alternata]
MALSTASRGETLLLWISVNISCLTTAQRQASRAPCGRTAHTYVKGLPVSLSLTARLTLLLNSDGSIHTNL